MNFICFDVHSLVGVFSTHTGSVDYFLFSLAECVMA